MPTLRQRHTQTHKRTGVAGAAAEAGRQRGAAAVGTRPAAVRCSSAGSRPAVALAGAWRRLQGRHRAPGRAARVELATVAAGVVAAPLILIYSVKVENKQNRPGHFRTRTGWVVGAPWARPTLIAAPSGHAWGRAAPFRRQKAVFQPKTPMAGRSKKRSRQINTIKMDHTTSRPHTLGS